MTDPRYHDQDEDDFDLRYYTDVLWQHRRIIARAAIVCGLIGFLTSILGPRLYESEAALAVSRPKLGEIGTETDVTQVANFIPFLSNRRVASQVIKEFGLEKDPYEASPTTFFGTYVSIQEVRNSTLLLVKGTMQD